MTKRSTAKKKESYADLILFGDPCGMEKNALQTRRRGRGGKKDDKPIIGEGTGAGGV